jgi:acyl-CoA thioester hydrolase
VADRFAYECALRWSDMDAYGHVNNARFLTLYEEARVALMFVGARSRGLTSFEDGVVIVRHEIDYLRPVDYDTGAADGGATPRVRIELWVAEVGAARFTIGYELFDRGELASRARSVLVPVDLPTGRPRRLTTAERAFLRAYSIVAAHDGGQARHAPPSPDGGTVVGDTAGGGTAGGGTAAGGAR